jgi:hypothetical protein
MSHLYNITHRGGSSFVIENHFFFTKTMKQRLLLLTMLVLAITTSYAQKNFWNEADQRYTVDNLKRTRDELTRETEHLTDAQWHSHVLPDRWSIAEVVEHVALWEIIRARKIGVGIRNTAHPEAPVRVAISTIGKFIVNWKTNSRIPLIQLRPGKVEINRN